MSSATAFSVIESWNASRVGTHSRKRCSDIKCCLRDSQDFSGIPGNYRGFPRYQAEDTRARSGAMCCLSVTVSLFPGGPKPSRVVFSAGKLADFAGKRRESALHEVTQRTPHAAKPRAKWMKICYTGSAEQGRGTVCCCEHGFRTRLGCL